MERAFTTTQALRLFKRTLVQKAKKIVSAFNSQTPLACGHDTLAPGLIKESLRAIAGPVPKILNTYIANSRYPSRWKMGQVTPLLKRDKELDKRNYRPVLPCLISSTFQGVEFHVSPLPLVIN